MKSNSQNTAIEHSKVDGAHGVAIITGAFLSGAMMALSLVAIPVYLDTTTVPTQLYHQWARTYHYGHQVLPALAVTTFCLYQWAALSKRARARPWIALTIAGIVTLTMVPFTWIFMVPTNNELFRLDDEGQSGTLQVNDFDEARRLVLHWGQLHITRSFFPLAGAVIGLGAVLGGS